MNRGTDERAEFEARIGRVFGDAGRAWLDALPEHLAAAVRRWGLTLGAPRMPSYGYVAPVRTHDGKDVMLKLAFPGDGWHRAVIALRLFDGRGVCRLLDVHGPSGAMLLGRVEPGTELAALASEDDDAATRAAAGAMRRIWRPTPAGCALPTVADRFEAIETYLAVHDADGPLPAATVRRAAQLAARLIATADTPVLLHGDLHHHNILDAGGGRWLAIDPKGVVGERGAEVGPLLLNPSGWSGTADGARLGRRLNVLAREIEYDRERLREWGIAFAVLSACWSVEDGDEDWRGALHTAAALEQC